MEGKFLYSGHSKDYKLSLQSQLDKILVCSLSTSYNNGLMWTHYVDEHKGCCIEIEVTATSWWQSVVTYPSNLPTIDENKSSSVDEAINTILSQKSENWKYENELDSAASYGGAGFGQELILHNGSQVPTIRPDNNSHQFRVLCAIGERLCIVESEEIITFGRFKQKLIEIGVSDAIYLDMGQGWDYAWYRHEKGDVIELNPETLDCGTNWITFYR